MIYSFQTYHIRHRERRNIMSESRSQCLLGGHGGLGKEDINVIDMGIRVYNSGR